MEDKILRNGTKMSESQKLREEIQYLTGMIGDYKKASNKEKYLNEYKTGKEKSTKKHFTPGYFPVTSTYKNKKWTKANYEKQFNDKQKKDKLCMESVSSLNTGIKNVPQMKLSKTGSNQTAGNGRKDIPLVSSDVVSLQHKEQSVNSKRTVVLSARKKQAATSATKTSLKSHEPISKRQVILPISQGEKVLYDSGPNINVPKPVFVSSAVKPQENGIDRKVPTKVLTADNKPNQDSVSKYKWVSPHSSPLKSVNSVKTQRHSESPSLLSSHENTSSSSEAKLKVCSLSVSKTHSPQLQNLTFTSDKSSHSLTPEYKLNLKLPSKDQKVYASTPQFSSQKKLPVPVKIVKSSQYKIVKQAISPILASTADLSPLHLHHTRQANLPSMYKTSKTESTVRLPNKNKYNFVKKRSSARSSPSVSVASNKYKFVRRRSSDKFKPTKVKIKELNSIKLSPAQTVMFASRHKLVKKAIHSTVGTFHHASSKFSYQTYTEKRRKSGSKGSKGGRMNTTRNSLHKSRNKYILRGNGKVREVNINHLLGRKIENASKSKYKFINKSTPSTAESSRKSRGGFYKRNPLEVSTLLNKNILRVNKGLKLKGKTVHIDGLMYRASRHKLNIRKTSSASKIYTWRASTLPSLKQQAASLVVHKSIVTAVKLKKTRAASRQYCIFFNRFGKCNRSNKCPYIHDPDKIAVCTRFLRGTCKVTDCPFSHKVAPDKMPVCTYFLRGVCMRDKCPYLHSNVSKDAAVCQDFLNGFCPKGVKCHEKHTLTCEEFSRTGCCQKGTKCPLKHIQSTAKKLRASGRQPTSSKLPKKRKTVECDDSNIPFKDRKLPAFIALEANLERCLEYKKDEDKQAGHLQIIPRLRIAPNQ